jgi:FtsH-binding integral membrane protein
MAFGPENRYAFGGVAVPRPDTAAIDAGLRSYMLRVYNYMASGVLLTGIVALLIASSPEISSLFYTRGRTASGLVAVAPTILGWIAILSPLAFILVLSFGINKLSAGATQALFWAFSAVMGISIANIFMIYTGTSVARVFFITAGTFGAMSLIGYTTKRDLTKMGSFLLMGLIGIILASLVNMFMQSSALQFAISVIGVLVFVGLIAYDTQRIKTDYVAYSYAEGTDVAAKRSVMDALTLYLNFINLFQLLMSLLGNRSSE